MQGLYVNNTLGKGTRAITVYEFDSAKIDDVLNLSPSLDIWFEDVF